MDFRIAHVWLLCERIAALRFQPTKRPQLSSQKGKPKPGFPRPTAPVDPDSTKQAAGTTAPPARPPAKSTLADWAVAGEDDDVNGFYGGGEKRQRGGRKRRKKNREEYAVAQDWDDIYDPSRPSSYDEYKHSDEQIREVREWKDRLYAHRKTRKYSSDIDSDEEPARPSMSSKYTCIQSRIVTNCIQTNSPLLHPLHRLHPSHLHQLTHLHLRHQTMHLSQLQEDHHPHTHLHLQNPSQQASYPAPQCATTSPPPLQKSPAPKLNSRAPSPKELPTKETERDLRRTNRGQADLDKQASRSA